MATVRETLAQASGFQWDVGNATKNWRKHDVSQSECEQIFFNLPLLLADDTMHSKHEARHFALGRMGEGRLLLVVFSLRQTLIRVISARSMSRREREVYRNAEANEVD